jgi:hypothetical protein
LDGSLLSSPTSGFDFGVGTIGISIVRGLVINRFPEEGIVVDPLNRGGLDVSNCFIGTDASGTLGLGNRDDGIFEDAQSNLGTFVVINTTISGNARDGIEIDGQGANGGLIENSFIGTNAAGTVGLGNGLRGIDLATGSGAIQIRGNVISGNAADGVFLQGRLMQSVNRLRMRNAAESKCQRPGKQNPRPPKAQDQRQPGSARVTRHDDKRTERGKQNKKNPDYVSMHAAGVNPRNSGSKG